MKKFLSFLIIVLIFLFGYFFNRYSNQYKTLKEYEDFNKWNKEVILLQGEWEYYPNQIIFPGEFYKSNIIADHVTVPFNLPEEVDYATFRLTLKVPYYAQLGLIVNEQNPHINVYVNDVYIQKDTHYPYYLQLNQVSYVDIVIHINNWNSSNGLDGQIALGSYDKIYFAYESYVRTQISLFWITLVLGVYFILLFLLTGKDKNILLYSIFTISTSILMLFIGNTFNVFNLTPKFFHQLQFIICNISVVSYILFVNSILKGRLTLNKGIFKGVVIFSILISIAILIIDEGNYAILHNALEIVLLILALYIYFKTSELLFSGSIHERIFIVSLYILLISVVTIFIKEYSLLNLNFVLYALAASILVQSLYFALGLYKKVEFANIIAGENKRMLLEVQRFNEILDKKINERTRELEELVKKDPLTDLFNHMHIFNIITDTLKDKDQVIHVFMADLDNFKEINDNHGHLAGDSVLIRVSEIMMKYKNDMTFGRYGGEEFLGLAVGKTREQVFQIVDKIREELWSITFEDIDHNVFRVSLSGGISMYKGQTVEELIKEADDHLYKAKKLGKNRICF